MAFLDTIWSSAAHVMVVSMLRVLCSVWKSGPAICRVRGRKSSCPYAAHPSLTVRLAHIRLLEDLPTSINAYGREQ
jgi:hypothetical protein